MCEEIAKILSTLLPEYYIEPDSSDSKVGKEFIRIYRWNPNSIPFSEWFCIVYLHQSSIMFDNIYTLAEPEFNIDDLACDIVAADYINRCDTYTTWLQLQ